MTEENTDQFCVCTECRPFSLVHTCSITPDRTPMCAARSYFTVKASAYFGSDQKPYKRRSETAVPLRHLFKRGKVIDLAGASCLRTRGSPLKMSKPYRS